MKLHFLLRCREAEKTDGSYLEDLDANMKLLQFVLVLQLSSLCPALLNVSTAAPPETTSEANIPETSSVAVVHHLDATCRWTLRRPGNRSQDTLPLPREFSDALVKRICRDLNCGGVHTVSRSMPPPNSTCFHNCSYQNRRLQTCSEGLMEGCVVTSEVVCGHQSLRLAGHEDRCAGRVEVWKDGRWGTACDDGWDRTDADVVCAQLGCGCALRATGQGGPFPAGRGPVHLDELNCSGTEETLWECPRLRDESDCGHKEDAGVVCSGSLAFQSETTAGVMTDVTTSGSADFPSPEHLIIMVLSVALLVLLVLNLVLCCLYRRRHVFALKQTRSNQRASTEHAQNHYKENLNLVKVSGVPQVDVPSNPRTVWRQISSVDSASVDTDYELYDPSNEPPVGLSTFRNSQRYRTDLNPSVKPSAEEGFGPSSKDFTFPNNNEGAPEYRRVSQILEDSFDSSSTSSGECYQNVNPSQDPDLPDISEPGQKQAAFCTNSGFQFELEGQEHSSDDDHDYSPVSPD